MRATTIGSAAMPDRSRRELTLLRLYAALATALLAVFTLGAFRQGQRPRFEEIDVQRINLVEPDGKLRMVISNRARSIGPIGYGKPFGYPGGSRPGIIFFNDEETENGGLTFGGGTTDGRFRASAGLSFDQYNQDQVVYIQYTDDNGRRRMGFTVADRADVPIMEVVARLDSVTAALPEGPARDSARRSVLGPRNGVPMFAERAYLGRDVRKAALLRLSDGQGRPRLVLQVDSTGAPTLEFLDAEGRVTARLPEGR
jgi:hypothetical protein